MSPAFAPVVPSASEPLLRSIVRTFLEENAQINLSAFRTEEACWIGNVLDSVAALDFLEEVASSSSIPAASSTPQPPPPLEEGEIAIFKPKPLPANTRTFAREMRKMPTKAEEVLWGHVRRDQLGVRFRRQYVLDGHIFDFFCPELRLVIEVDGNIHSSDRVQMNDRERDTHFSEFFCITTLRLTNEEVLSNLDASLTRIKQAIQYTKTHKFPSSSGGGARGGGNSGERGAGELRILDLGTGGGFPLLALATCMPEATFIGLDSVRKKIDAVTRVVKATGLQNVQMLCGRAEEVGRKGPYRGKFDVVTSRAVGSLAVLLELSAPLLKVGGYALCWKSLQIEEELTQSERAQKELKITLHEKMEYTLPGDWGTRQILCFQKQAPTPGTYPRETGVPGKFPLI